MRKIRTTFQTISPESAVNGDYEETGWIDEDGHCIDPDDYDVDEYGSEFHAIVALATDYIGDCVSASDYPRCCPGHTWYTDSDDTVDYNTGNRTTHSYHLDGFTEDEEIAIYAYLTGRGL
jgi:hypothetical protein